MSIRNDSVPFIKLNDETSSYIILSFYIIAISSIKLLYTWVSCFSRLIPESNLLLLCGLVIGFSLNKMKNIVNFKISDIFHIKSDTFFYILLPPIILESSFSIYHKTFATNLAGVLIFAVIATLLNFFSIAFGLGYLNEFDYMSLIDETVDGNTIWIFSALIVAVDPVAVLAIFQEIHVDNNLYYLVFGESLLNDGVSVVLYDVMITMSSYKVVSLYDIFRAVVAFVFVGVGGMIVGCAISIITCLLTRFTVKTPLIEPIMVMAFGYLSYLLANAISWSGIISMIAYGVLQAAYGFQNITTKSLILVKRLSKILSSLSESIIFLNLGVTVTSLTVNPKSSFLLWSIFLCLYSRFTFTLLLSAVLNYFRFNIRKLKWNEQFIIAYGGLRGGIAFCLAELISEKTHVNKKLIQETTVVIIFFTIFFMGFTMKPLVKMLNIQIAKPDELSLFLQVTESAIEHLLAGVEEIIGLKGRNSIFELFANIDELYIRPFLQRDRRGRDEKIMKMFEKMNLTMHMATTTMGTPMSDYYLHKLKPNLRNMLGENSRMDASVPHGLSTLNYTTEETKSEAVSSKRFKMTKKDSLENIEFLPTRPVTADPLTFFSRMSTMLYRKRLSLAVTHPKPAPFPILHGRLSRITLDSELDLQSLILKKKPIY